MAIYFFRNGIAYACEFLPVSFTYCLLSFVVRPLTFDVLYWFPERSQKKIHATECTSLPLLCIEFPALVIQH
jgi:hypothetical protein